MKNKGLLLRLCCIAMLLVTCVQGAWAIQTTNYKAKAVATSTGNGTVYAGTTNAEGTYQNSSTASANQNANGAPTFTFYLFAKPNAGYGFKGWSQTNNVNGAIESTASPYTLEITGAENEGNATQTRYAIFAPLPTFYFSANAIAVPAAGGTASVSLPNTSKRAETWDATSAETEATFTASPNSGYAFIGWSATEDGAILSENSPYVFTASSTSTNSGSPSNTTLYARFVPGPTSISVPQHLTIYTGDNSTIAVSLEPNPCYRNLTFSSSNASIVSVDANGVITGNSVGKATITINALNTDGVSIACSTTMEVTVVEKCVSPEITFTPKGMGETADVTITCPNPGDASIYYTVNGSAPSIDPALLYTGSFEVNSNDVVRAIASKDGWEKSDIASATYTAYKLQTPTIEVVAGGVVFDSNDDDVTFHYTTDGSDPTASSPSATAGSTVPIGGEDATVKVLATKTGCIPSDIASKQYVIQTGISGNTVYLNDYEDHTWTYYQPTGELPAGYPTGYLHSPDPRNVKITYRGGSVDNASAVAISTTESQNTMVYFKTIEKTEPGMTGNYAYQVISNPFSKRPRTTGSTGTNGYFGFAGWKVVSGGKYIAEHADKDVLGLDEIIHFTNLDENYTPNCKSGEVIFEATWTAATVKTGNSAQSFTGGTYETNFWVLNGNIAAETNNNRNPTAIASPCTVSSLNPDGSGTVRYGINRQVQVTATSGVVKLEYMAMNGTGAYDANGKNLHIGRGMTNSGDGATLLTFVNTANTRCTHTVKVESGKYQEMLHFNTAQNAATQIDQLVILGCDYDRAAGNNNNLTIIKNMRVAQSVQLNRPSGSAVAPFVRTYIKSGDFLSNVNVAGNNSYTGSGGDQTYYYGVSGTHNAGRRYLVVEGGHLRGIAGGMDEVNAQETDGRSLDIRVRGTAQIDGVIYGAATFAGAKGNRTMVFTGGTINGWVAAGANGTQSSGGLLNGTSYLYVGGKTIVDSHGSNQKMNQSIGGIVYGAGCGNNANSSSGQVQNGTNVVLADEAYVERGVYGGGGFGYTEATANIWVTGGKADGGVFGGANQNKGGVVNITMTGGQVNRGVFGGSDATGEVAGDVTIKINGGNIGDEKANKLANVHGGGYGQNTVITKNVDITLGEEGQETPGVTIYGDVYGGSALGSVNGTAATNTYHTNVTLNAGTIHGSLYGGALGSASVAANVNGPVQVVVNGGSVKQTAADGSGGVYGCNNINGAPQRAVSVTINGTDPANGSDYALYSVYGGGNKAAYTYGTPTVTVNNCDNSIEYVYGGGNAAPVPATDVTIWGGNTIGNVFGGGNGTVQAANVTGNVWTKIYGGTINNIYGGSNSQGTIGGTITVDVDAQGTCPMHIGNLYGGGNRAASNVGKLNIKCTGDDGSIDAVYGGANAANVTGNIDLKISGGRIGTLYGGNNAAGNISGNIDITVARTIDGNTNDCGVLDIGTIFGGGNEADFANTVTIHIDGNDDKTIGNIYGGGNLASVNSTSITMKGGTVTGSIFGGGKGTDGSSKVMVNAGGTNVLVYGGTVGDIFGGNDAGGTINGPLSVTIDKTQGDDAGALSITGDVYGGGNQADSNAGTISIVCANDIKDVYGGAKNANITGDIVLNVGSGQIGRVFGGNNVGGNVTGSITVNVEQQAGECGNNFTIGNVYGGGNEAAYQPAAPGAYPAVNITSGTITNNVYGGGLGETARVTSNPVVTMTGGSAAFVYGGGEAAPVTGNPTVNITGAGATVANDVFGGGLGTTAVVTGATAVTIDQGHVRSVFGGGSEAPTRGSTNVTIANATTGGSVFGGGKGKSAVVVGDTNLNIGDWNDDHQATITGDAFGGGDLAAVEGNCNITIRDCGTQILGDLYGGGNAAPVYSTNTTMWGGTVTGNLFGGGNGEDAAKNPNGAQIGYRVVDPANNVEEVASTATGNVTTNVFGGTIGSWTSETECATNTGGIFGGSNTRGNIKGEIIMSVEERASTEDGATQCKPLKFREIYGAGNQAAYAGTGITFNLGCVDYLDEIYGGAKQADLKANVTLNLSSGHIRKVFGGNNISGALDGSITIQIDETGCNPLIIDDLYLGGNQAAYSVFGYNSDGTVKTSGDAKADPVINIISATSVGRVFGGGLGETATIVGNPTVNVNMIPGDHAALIDGKAGTIGTIFGGGDAAPVQGNTTINIGTEATNKHIGADDASKVATSNTITGDIFGGGLGTTAIVKGNTNIAILSNAQVDGNVYGGGNAADVTGKTNITIGPNPAP